MPAEPLTNSTLEELFLEDGTATAAGAPRRVFTNTIDVRADVPGGHLWPAHSHAEHELLWGVTGGLTVRTPRAAYIVPRGLGLWLPSGVPHEVQATPGTSLSCTWFAAPLVPDGPVATVMVGRLLAEVLLHLQRPGLADPSRARAEDFAADLVPAGDRQLPPLPLPTATDLRALADAILDDPADRASVSDLATTYGLSERTLSRRFRAETGLSVARWRTQARVFLATRELARGAPPSLVARRSGFGSASAFGAAFRRVVGVSPGNYGARVRRAAADVDIWPSDDII